MLTFDLERSPRNSRVNNSHQRFVKRSTLSLQSINQSCNSTLPYRDQQNHKHNEHPSDRNSMTRFNFFFLLFPSPFRQIVAKMMSLGGTTATNKTVLDRYMKLPIPDDKCQVMYVWVDGSGENLRSKTRTINFIPKSPSGKKE